MESLIILIIVVVAYRHFVVKRRHHPSDSQPFLPFEEEAVLSARREKNQHVSPRIVNTHCNGCGASLQPGLVACEYCGLETGNPPLETAPVLASEDLHEQMASASLSENTPPLPRKKTGCGAACGCLIAAFLFMFFSTFIFWFVLI